MSLKSLVNGIALAAIATGSLTTSGAAEARDWRASGSPESHHGELVPGRHESRHGVYVNRWGEVRSNRHSGGRGSWAHRRDEGYGHHHDSAARNIAIGTFAAVLGLALAAESRRVQENYYDERD